MNNPNIEIKYRYKDEEYSLIFTVTLEEIRKNIGFEYSLPDNVWKFYGEHDCEILEIKIDGVVMWPTSPFCKAIVLDPDAIVEVKVEE